MHRKGVSKNVKGIIRRVLYCMPFFCVIFYVIVIKFFVILYQFRWTYYPLEKCEGITRLWNLTLSSFDKLEVNFFLVYLLLSVAYFVYFNSNLEIHQKLKSRFSPTSLSNCYFLRSGLKNLKTKWPFHAFLFWTKNAK